MQERLFRGSAEPYTEPPFSLEIFSVSNGQWENVSGDRLKMRIQVRNVANYRTVKAFELYMYATDVWGERIYGEDQIYYGYDHEEHRPRKTATATTWSSRTAARSTRSTSASARSCTRTGRSRSRRAVEVLELGNLVRYNKRRVRCARPSFFCFGEITSRSVPAYPSRSRSPRSSG